MTSAQLARLLIDGPSVLEKQLFGPGEQQAGSALALIGQTRDAGGSEKEQQQLNPSQIDKKIAVFVNRAVLRIWSVPSFQAYLNDVVVFKDPQAKDGQCRIQFVFHRLPEEVHPELLRVLSGPRDPKLTRFVDKGQAQTGVELVVKPEDFGGEEYDYAF